MQLRHHAMCAFPSVFAGADTVYCGKPTGGQSYCKEHRAVMYTNATSATTYVHSKRGPARNEKKGLPVY